MPLIKFRSVSRAPKLKSLIFSGVQRCKKSYVDTFRCSLPGASVGHERDGKGTKEDQASLTRRGGGHKRKRVQSALCA